MKKIFSLITSLFLLAVLPIGAQRNEPIGTEVITLSHNGQETNFKYNEIGKALDQAADGDTVYFSTGYFQGDIRLLKKVTFIGSGADRYDSNGNYVDNWSNCTCIDGKVVIALPEGTQLTSRLFDGIYFNGNGDNRITFTNSIDNVVFRKCYWNNSWSINAEIKNLLIDRCSVDLYDLSNVKKLVARNCEIRGISDNSSVDPNSRHFYHCYISPSIWETSDANDKKYWYCGNFAGIFTNCIIPNYTSRWDNSTQQSTYYAAYLSNPNGSQENYPVFINCLYYTQDGVDVTANCTLQNSYGYGITNEKRIENLTKEELQSAGYMGNDNTVVGYYGGKNPYSLRTNLPEVSSSKVHLDRDAKQLQINIKVSAQQ